MAKLSTDELLDAFKEMTLLELSDFVKKFEETFEPTRPARWCTPPNVPPRRMAEPNRSGPRSPR